MNKLQHMGRMLLALPFLLIGINHFIMQDVFLGMISSFIPHGVYAIFLTGAILIVSAIFIMLNKMVKTFSYVLAGMLLLFIVTIHIPGMFNPALLHVSLFGLLKDVGLMGGLILIAANNSDK